MDTKQLIFATNNKHKLEEIKNIIGDQFTILSLNDIDFNSDIPETADTLEGNASLKAKHISDIYGLNCFADDTGLEIESLDNAPGVFSARYAGEDKDSEANMLKVLDKLNGISNRKARFRTVISLIFNHEEFLFEGIINGKITDHKKGNSGFGYDPIFIPDGYNETFAELGNDIKNQISHRAQAINKLCSFLNHKINI